jgi:small subunit ribosomal protein S5
MADFTPNKQTTNNAAGSSDRRGGGSGMRRPRREGGFADRPKDVDQKILDIRRVTRVVAGGRRMSFAVSMIIGDKNGVVGVGTGKGGDTALAIAKALKDAKKHAIKIKRTEKLSIPFDVKAKYNASRVMIFPNNGKGIVVGAAIRDIAVLAGLKDISGKVISGSKNKLNTARAAIKALQAFSVPHIFGAAQKVEVAPTVAAAVEPEVVS